MYPPLALNGLKTRPGLPGTGLATGNCACGEDDGFTVVLLAAIRGLGLADARFDLRNAVRDAGDGDGEGSATGCPGFVTSDAFAAGVGSGSLKTWRTGAVMARPISCAVSQPTKPVAISAIAQLLQLIAVLYR